MDQDWEDNIGGDDTTYLIHVKFNPDTGWHWPDLFWWLR